MASHRYAARAMIDDDRFRRGRTLDGALKDLRVSATTVLDDYFGSCA